MKVEVDVLVSPSLIVMTVSVDAKQRLKKTLHLFRNCVKVEVAVLGSPSLKRLMIFFVFLFVCLFVCLFFDVKAPRKKKSELRSCVKVEGPSRAPCH